MSISPSLQTWTVVDDGKHNAFTDLLHWRGQFWLAYISSPSHFASKHSRVVILRSDDAQDWQEVVRFSGNGEDIRDPKLGVVDGQLFLYALLNKRFDPEPYKTITAHSNDGATWSALEAVTPTGWLLGRPVTTDNATWFTPAHRIDHGTAALLRSTDGVTWEIHSTIHAGDRADETAVQLLADGRLLAVTRLEAGGGILGNAQAGTLISSARPPFTEWTQLGWSKVTRLDGPTLVRHGERVYALGRRQVRVARPFLGQGSALGRKRSALFVVEDGALIHLIDLPSAGDTSYPGAVIVNEKLFVSYYTNDPRHDPSWLVGMLKPTKIQMARIDLKILEETK
ncbi:MAG: sialidase family protein [Chloroflexota bacterium]